MKYYDQYKMKEELECLIEDLKRFKEDFERIENDALIDKTLSGVIVSLYGVFIL